MGSENNIKIVLEAVNNAQSALESVRKQLEDVGTTAEQTEEKSSSLGTAFSNLGGLVAGFAGVGGLSYMVNEATNADKSLVRLQLSLGRYSDELKNSLTPQIVSAGKNIEGMGLASDELAQETIARLLPTFKNDLPRAINGASTLLTLMKYDVRGASAVLNFLGEDSDFARQGMIRLAKAVGVDVNPKMDDLAEVIEKVQRRLKDIKLPPFVQEMGKLLGNISTLSENVGAKILQIINPLLAGLNALMDIPFVGKILEWATAFGTVGLAIYGALKLLGLIPTVVKLATEAWWLMQFAMLAIEAVAGLSIGWVALIVAGLVGLGIIIYKAITDWDGFKNIVGAVWTAIVEWTIRAWENIKTAISNAMSSLKTGLANFYTAMLYTLGVMAGSIVKFFLIDIPAGIVWFANTWLPNAIALITAWFAVLPSRIWNALSSIPSIMANIFNGAKTIISGILNDIMGWVSDLPSRMLSGIRSGLNFVINSLNTFISGFNAVVPENLKMGKIPMLADGGIITRPTMAILGENGAEAVIPLNRMGGAGMGYNINIDFSGSVLLSENVAVQIGDKIIDRLRKNIHIPSRSF